MFILIFLGMSYPLYSIRPRISDRFDNNNYSLSGIEYMLENQYSQKGKMLNLSDSYYALDYPIQVLI